VAAWLEDRKGHFAVSWWGALTNKWGPKPKSFAVQYGKSGTAYNALFQYHLEIVFFFYCLSSILIIKCRIVLVKIEIISSWIFTFSNRFFFSFSLRVFACDYGVVRPNSWSQAASWSSSYSRLFHRMLWKLVRFKSGLFVPVFIRVRYCRHSRFFGGFSVSMLFCLFG